MIPWQDSKFLQKEVTDTRCDAVGLDFMHQITSNSSLNYNRYLKPSELPPAFPEVDRTALHLDCEWSLIFARDKRARKILAYARNSEHTTREWSAGMTKSRVPQVSRFACISPFFLIVPNVRFIFLKLFTETTKIYTN